MNKLQKFITIVNSKIGQGYVYGGQNEEPLTQAALDIMIKKFGRDRYYFSNYSAEKWIGREYYDCSGLIVYALRKMELILNKSDFTSQSLYTKLCLPITKDDLRAGDLCFKKTSDGIVHVGIYIGDKRVTHARGTFYGIVNTTLFNSFNLFGRIKFFANEDSEPTVKLEKSVKKVIFSTGVYQQPNGINIIGNLAVGSAVYVDELIDDSWYMINLNGKKGYVPFEVLSNYNELLNAISFLSVKTGISEEYWYKQSGNIKWLDLCFIKIAKGFGLNNH